MITIPSKTKVHIIGIGGIGMSAIAEILLDLGCKLSGSDISKNANTSKLISRGAEVFVGHQAENIKDDVDLVVHSTAVSKKTLK